MEVKVEERTKELKKLQMEKMEQLYRFAEFGQLSSGLFHDLINPLTAISGFADHDFKKMGQYLCGVLLGRI